MFRIVIAVIFALVILLTAFGCESSRKGIRIASSRSYEASLFRQNCAICHGPEGGGKTMDGQPVPSLRTGEPATRSLEEIYQQIAFGKMPMPAFKDQLTESEMRRMAMFIKEKVQGR